ncbi:alkaline phosphatase family protein [Paenibacillus sp. GCM10027626]|uniref:alkaline phosphatase family protein n=1 Tax=Paenibacillus sp. GCM10027626 TaxID=3273411 RepID=UPI003635BFE9
MNVLLSLDGLSYQLFEHYASTFIKNGFFYCKKLITTFPSVTFNAHATAITGNQFDKHLVVDNVLSRTGSRDKVLLYGDHELICNEALHRQTLFYSLANKGLKSCCIHWPLTSGNIYIDHLVTESSSKKKISDAEPIDKMDQLALQEAIQAIASGAFDFIAARFVGYDALSHKHGKESPEALRCLHTLLGYIAKIHNELEKSQAAYNLIVFSDHGQSDVRTFFYPNEVLARSRWRQHLLANQIRFVGDGSGALLFYSSLEPWENAEIMDYFNGLAEVNRFYVVEGDAASEFIPAGILDLNHTVCGEDILAPEQPQYEEMKSLHGYHPDNVDEMNGFMVGIGRQIKPGKVMEQEHLQNIAPTLAKLFQIPHICDGREINDIIREHD